jgi:hypothetical protein
MTDKSNYDDRGIKILQSIHNAKDANEGDCFDCPMCDKKNFCVDRIYTIYNHKYGESYFVKYLICHDCGHKLMHDTQPLWMALSR